MAESDPKRDQEQGARIVAHVGHVREEAHLEDIHLHRLERDERRRNLKWMAVIVVLSLLATGLALWLSHAWVDFKTYAPGYEPKDQSRQQQMEQFDRDRQKEGP